MKTIPYFISILLAALIALALHRGGWWLLLMAAFMFVFIPVVDTIVGRDTRNPEEGEVPPGRHIWRDLPLYLWVVLYAALVGFAVWKVGRGGYSLLEIPGVCLTTGLLGGAIGINVSHELIHRKERFERVLAELLLWSVSYLHWGVEHVYGHHRWVATPRDPATSRLGESVYQFYPRTIVGTLRSAWHIEGERAAKAGLRWYSLRDRRNRYPLMTIALYAAAWIVSGPLGVLVLAVSGVIAALILETINYIEHYGLLRRELSPGKYERVQPHHSWNASERVSNWFLFNLQRHSDHHYLASRPYHQLRHYEDVPQLPYGYATMLLMALVPPLWHRVMDERALAWRETERTSPEA